ncbi:hypothetical protein ACFE04_024326 [Oxalis oulophora]
MGVEGIPCEIPQVPEIDSGLKHEKENGKPDKVKRTIKISSQELEPVEVEALVDDNIPRNAAFEWPAPKAVHSLYFVRYRPYDDPKARAEMNHADKDMKKKNKARFQLIEELRAKKSDKAELINQLRSLKAEGSQYKAIIDDKKQEIDSLQEALGNLQTNSNAGRNGGICSSEEELDELIRSLQYHMEHESIPSTEEKQIMKEIKQLEGTRQSVIANSEMRAKIEDSMGEKDAIQDQVKLIVADLDEIRKDNQIVWSKINDLEEELKIVDAEIRDLREELAALIQKRDKAFQTIQELRKQRDDDNTFFRQSREVLTQAELLAVIDGDKRKETILELEQLSRKEVDNFIALYSMDESFRNDYQRRLLSSLDQRQMSRDGRIRNPDEEPVIPVEEPLSEPETIEMSPVKQVEEEQEDIVKAENEKVENVSNSDEEQTILMENPDEDTAIDNEVDEAKLKEMKREEEIAKAKLAMERKKKLAEKAAAKASLRAQKEAEKKLKGNERKAKKKAGGSGEEGSDSSSEPEKEDSKSDPAKEKVIKKESSFRYRNKAVRGPESVPKAILKRKKNNNLYWMLAAPTALAVLILLVVGFYNLL